MRINRVSWVDKDDCFATIKLGPDRFDGRMAKVSIIVAASCKEGDAIGMQRIESVFQSQPEQPLR